MTQPQPPQGNIEARLQDLSQHMLEVALRHVKENPGTPVEEIFRRVEAAEAEQQPGQ